MEEGFLELVELRDLPCVELVKQISCSLCRVNGLHDSSLNRKWGQGEPLIFLQTCPNMVAPEEWGRIHIIGRW